jgi:hypothetical protein
MAATTDADLLLDIPDPDTIRNRLAVVMTEANLLKAQLRVSERLVRERDRLQRQASKKGADDAHHQASR